LGSKSGEATFTTQTETMPATPFNPQNLGANKVPLKSQQAMYFQFAQPAYPMRTPSTNDFTMKES